MRGHPDDADVDKNFFYRLNRDFRIEEESYSEDVRFHHRICDALKHLLFATVILMEQSINQETKFE